MSLTICLIIDGGDHPTQRHNLFAYRLPTGNVCDFSKPFVWETMTLVSVNALTEIEIVKYIGKCDKLIRYVSNPSKQMKDLHEMVWEL